MNYVLFIFKFKEEAGSIFFFMESGEAYATKVFKEGNLFRYLYILNIV